MDELDKEKLEKMLKMLAYHQPREEYIAYIWKVEATGYPHKESGYRWELKSKHAEIRSVCVFKNKCAAVNAVNNYTTRHQIGTKNWYFPQTSDIEIGWQDGLNKGICQEKIK